MDLLDLLTNSQSLDQTRNAAAFLLWMAAQFPDLWRRILSYFIQPAVGTSGFTVYNVYCISMQKWPSDRPSAAQLIP